MGHSNELKLKKMAEQWKPGQPLSAKDRELLRPIIEAAETLGYTPRVQDVPNAAEIKERFRTWKNALTAAEFPLYSAPEQEVLRRIAADQRETFTQEMSGGDSGNGLNIASHAEIIQMALERGFHGAAIISMDDVVTDCVIRMYCEDNRCGRFNTNYACPPVCGTPEEMENRLRSFRHALVLQTKWPADNYKDREVSAKVMRRHNLSMLRMLQILNASGYNGLITGIGCCTLCEKCAKLSKAPCRFPQYAISCTSAYCICMDKLAQKCNMEYNFPDGSMALFSLYAF